MDGPLNRCKNRTDRFDMWSLRKAEMVRKFGVRLAAGTLKAMSSWSLWAMRGEDATPMQQQQRNTWIIIRGS